MMQNQKYYEMWNLLKKYNFHLDLDINSDLLCTICKTMLINAYQSRCGCRYCLSCIEDYLCGEEKCCPGQIDDCKEQIIHIDRDLHIDNSANRRLSMTKVKCPEEFCHFIDELKNMTSHIESHQVKCPFADMGCNNPRTHVACMKEHLNGDIYAHTMMIMEYNQNLRNEIDSLKEDANKKEISIAQLIIDNGNQIATLTEDCKRNRELIDELLKEIIDRRIQETVLKEQIAEMKKTEENNINELTCQLAILQMERIRDRELVDKMRLDNSASVGGGEISSGFNSCITLGNDDGVRVIESNSLKDNSNTPGPSNVSSFEWKLGNLTGAFSNVKDGFHKSLTFGGANHSCTNGESRRLVRSRRCASRRH